MNYKFYIINRRVYINRLLALAWRKRVLLGVILILILLYFIIAPDVWFLYTGPWEDVSCHYLPEQHAYYEPVLPIKSIFFLETSCRGDLAIRQACSVESAARSLPNWQINVFFVAPMSPAIIMKLLAQRYTNVKPTRINIVELSKGTPLEALVVGGALNRTRWRISHTSDVLRYLTLYKWSGIYLDMDMVVAKNFDDLTNNFASKISNSNVEAGVMSFSSDRTGRRIAKAAIRDMRKNFRGDKWGHNGPGVISRVLRSFCDTNDVAMMDIDTCNGFTVYKPEVFYPISWKRRADYFNPSKREIGSSYGYHIWASYTNKLTVDKNSFYSRVAKEFCPLIYDNYKEEFGY